MVITDTKQHVARAQLGTALELFIRDKDPVSVHCLACGAAEVIEQVSSLIGLEPFSTVMLAKHPHLDIDKLRGIRNQYWNAFKHLNDRRGKPRDDEELLATFNDRVNDAALFCGWLDYVKLTGKLPIAAQVFQIWWYALNENKLDLSSNLDAIRSTFPGLTTVSRLEQKRRLRRCVEKWRNDKLLKSSPQTEVTLLAPWPAV